MIDGPDIFLETETGWLGRLSNAVAFFGNRNSVPHRLYTADPGIRYSFLNQIHSDRSLWLEAEPTSPLDASTTEDYSAGDWPEGDAHITRLKGVALCIRTADCMPLLLAAPGMIASIHAGWRGIDAEIIQKTLSKMKAAGADLNLAKAAIGPHIARESFEVGVDLAERLHRMYRKLRWNRGDIVHPHRETGKRFVDLSLLARAQLIQAGIREEAITQIKLDTLSDERMHSYRRDKGSAGRQTSFIYIPG